MNAKPIIFSGEMVRALLEGRKVQTRRVVKPQPEGRVCWLKASNGMTFLHRFDGSAGDEFRCPYGQPGDLLWVRETFMEMLGTGVEHYDPSTLKRTRYAYGADTPPGSHGDEARKDFGLKWKRSIHMPRAASRLTLELADVRVQRLHEISDDDARAEGFGNNPDVLSGKREGTILNEAEIFANYWHFDLYPNNEVYGWHANPWVWALTFKVYGCNVARCLDHPISASWPLILRNRAA